MPAFAISLICSSMVHLASTLRNAVDSGISFLPIILDIWLWDCAGKSKSYFRVYNEDAYKLT